MKKRIPFSRELCQTLKPGEARLVLECGTEVKVINKDVGGEYPIVVMASKEDAVPFRINEHGEPQLPMMSNVYIELNEEDYTEFEQAVADLLSPFIEVSEETVKNHASKLLTIARKDFLMPQKPVDVLALLKSLNLRILEIADEKRGQDKKYWEQAWRLTNNAINSIQDKQILNC